MTVAVYPGTFDPITLGHVDVVRRACSVFDRVVVGVAHNAAKAGSHLFDLERRVALARAALAPLPGVEVAVVPGLLADFCRERGAGAIVKGLRSGSDLDAEVPMALLNRDLGAPETVFLVAAPAHAHISSSLVKDVARHGGDVSALVPPGVVVALAQALAGAVGPTHAHHDDEGPHRDHQP
ncbi:MAG: pantetheine-phosphate adenylyltransferase [Actinomyces sp.]|uniref:pantetheine-phosphate adenylyltransferase n=1 Tax=Actinomyces sp. TaxID=29317 RepID=UPI0026DD61EA|nr:pantetheine-phosphate adenylyltransferase [Actinomyces sp.]MDO4242664.1 pantetheine-phosphate adenylyltransferase [Actinomyces sp.]